MTPTKLTTPKFPASAPGKSAGRPAVAPAAPVLQVHASDERRRSQRVMVRIPVTLHFAERGKEESLKGHTVAVNDHGAMVLCAKTLAAGAKLALASEGEKGPVPCRVTRAPRETPEGFLVPVEFEKPQPGYWHISFPPTSWKPTGG